MSRAYYYFAASLPMIDFDNKPPFSVENYLEDCLRLLSRNDFELMNELLTQKELPEYTDDQVVNAWIKFYEGFWNELTWQRAKRAGKDPESFIRSRANADSRQAEVIQRALKEVDLLEAERILDRFRWEFLNELEKGQFFNFGFLVIYGLKLKILEKYQRIQSSQGQEIFEEIKKVDLLTIRSQW